MVIRLSKKELIFTHMERLYELGIKKVEANEITACCVFCGNEIYVRVINDMNAIFRDNAVVGAIVEKERE